MLVDDIQRRVDDYVAKQKTLQGQIEAYAQKVDALQQALLFLQAHPELQDLVAKLGLQVNIPS